MTPYLIAEIGINHNGNIGLAKKLIFEAKAAGFDAVKFQKRTIDIVYSKEYLLQARESPFGTTNGEQKRALEFGREEYDEIDRYCREVGIDWSASAWDVESQLFLRHYRLAFNKVASPMLGHIPLLKMIAEEKKVTFVSTGMSTLEELDEVVDLFERRSCPITLMHCNSTYPMPDEDANLRVIETLKSRYGKPVGYSGHESTLLKVCLSAVVLGATVIERHITLDRAMYGSDQSASIQVDALKSFVTALRAVNAILGDGRKTLTQSEMDARKKLRVTVDG